MAAERITRHSINRSDGSMDRTHFSSLKRLMQSRILSHRGFCKGKAGLYYRLAGHGIVAIEVQTANFGNDFFVNIGWTFSELPAFTSGEFDPPNRMCLLDFALHGRLERISEQAGLPPRWTFMEGETESQANLELSLALGADAADRVSEHFCNYSELFTKVPPELLMMDFEDRLRTAREGWLVEPVHATRIRSFLHGFYPTTFPLAYSLAHLAVGIQDRRLAEKYLVVARRAAWFEHEKRLVSSS
jgi:hypothetical protein